MPACVRAYVPTCVQVLVDSAFFVLRRAMSRAAHTCDGGIGVGAVRHAAELLEKLLLSYLREQVRSRPSPTFRHLLPPSAAFPHPLPPSLTLSHLPSSLDDPLMTH